MSVLPTTPATARRSVIWLVVVGAVLLLAAAPRLVNLPALPPFIDEGGHLYEARDYTTWTLLDRLRHGKMFGFVVFYPTAQYADDPLIATRALVATLGVLTTLGVMLLVRRLSTTFAAVVAGTLWATMPYVVFHDRMALHDPLIACFVVWSTFVLAVALDRSSRGLAMTAGALMALAILTKISAVLAMALPLFVVVAPRGWRLREEWRAVLAFGLLPTLAVLSMALGAVLGVHQGEQFLRGDEVRSWLSIWQTAMAAPRWASSFNTESFTWLAGLCLAAGILLPGATRATSMTRRALALAFLAIVAGHAVVLKIWFSRYLLFSLLALVMLMGIVLGEWGERVARAIAQRRVGWREGVAAVGLVAASLLIVGFAPSWLSSDRAFTRDPRKALLPIDDRFQYMMGWPSGYGLSDVVAFLNRRAQESGNLVVIVGGFARPGSWMLPHAGKLDPRIVVRSDHLLSRDALLRAADAAGRQPTYVLLEPPEYVIEPSLLAAIEPKPMLVFEYKRADSGRWQLYELASSTRITAAQ